MSPVQAITTLDAGASDLSAARSYLLGALGLAGPLLCADAMAEAARALGMIQIDSIRVCGLRSHEIAWVARGEAPVSAYYDLLYRRREFVEMHYPMFAIRRDWLSWFQQDFAKMIVRRERLRELRPLMRRLKRHIRDHGPVTPADFESERVPGGFSTVKATTLALEYLYCLGDLQIAGRTSHFHRVFDLTERVAPEILEAPKAKRETLAAFCVHSAAMVLKLATSEQLARRAAHHLGTWRGGLPIARKALDQALAEGVVVESGFARTSEGEPFLIPAEHAAGAPPALDDTIRLIPPLDNLLFSRSRFAELFGLSYKFEAYTPRHLRRFYFALPILYRDRVIGLIDAKKDGETWQVVELEIERGAPMDELRHALRRLAGIAGANKIACANTIPGPWRKALNGRLDR